MHVVRVLGIVKRQVNVVFIAVISWRHCSKCAVYISYLFYANVPTDMSQMGLFA